MTPDGQLIRPDVGQFTASASLISAVFSQSLTRCPLGLQVSDVISQSREKKSSSILPNGEKSVTTLSPEPELK